MNQTTALNVTTIPRIKHREDGMNELQVRERSQLTTAELIAEWAATHGEPFTLELDGPAGGRYTAGAGGEHLHMDAIDFVTILAERGHGDGILRHPLPL